MKKLTRKQASTIFKARTRMIKVKGNYKNGYPDLTCRACQKDHETQAHVLYECKKLNPDTPISDMTETCTNENNPDITILNNLINPDNPETYMTDTETLDIFDENPETLRPLAKRINDTLDELMRYDK